MVSNFLSIAAILLISQLFIFCINDPVIKDHMWTKTIMFYSHVWSLNTGWTVHTCAENSTGEKRSYSLLWYYYFPRSDFKKLFQLQTSSTQRAKSSRPLFMLCSIVIPAIRRVYVGLFLDWKNPLANSNLCRFSIFRILTVFLRNSVLCSQFAFDCFISIETQ